MFVRINVLLAAASALMGTSVVVAAPVSSQPNLIIFGNSLSDTGNTAALTHTPSYWNGRASNSYVWNEYTAKLLGYTLVNKAYAGATSNNVLSPASSNNITIPSFHDQVSAWLQQNPSPSSFSLANDVIQVEIGGNDILHRAAGLFTGTVNVADFISKLSNSIASDVQTLADAGYKNIVVWNLPAVDKTPAVVSLGASALVKPLVDSINSAISRAINGVIAKNKDKTQGIYLRDLNALFNVVFDPQVLAALGITETAKACFVKSSGGQATVCQTPDSYFFYDAIHPASRIHYLWGIAAAILTRNPNAVVDVPAALSLIKTFNLQGSNRDHNIIVDGMNGAESSAVPPVATPTGTYATANPTPTSKPPSKCH
ncbi:hypothetical protein GGI12_000463 [Dipsacomyces acuminosporus]|nr:hypothetical protein GGI12_000463 [Dipsacomyces acuminosporus]